MGVVHTFFVPGKLPGLNDLSHVKSWRVGGEMKKEGSARVALAAQLARIPAIERPVYVTIVCHEPNKRRDPADNVVGGALKCSLDGLRAAGVLRNDGWKEIRGLTATWLVSDEPGVWVKLEEV